MTAAFALAGGVIHFFVFPWIVRKSATDALTKLGVADPRFNVARATLWGATLTNLTAASGDIRAASVAVSYQPLKVVSGEVDRVTLDGVRVRLAVRGGKLDLPVNSAGDSPAPKADALRLPFRELAVSASVVSVEWDGQAVEFPISGLVTNRGADDVSAAVDVKLATPSADLTLPGGAKLQGPAGVLHLGATIHAAGVDVRLTDDSWLGFRGLVVGAEASAMSLGETRVSVRPSNDRPLVSLKSGPDAPDPAVDLELAVYSAAVHHANSGASLAGIVMHVPVSMNSTAAARHGPFEIASVMLGKQKLDPIRGTLGVADKKATFSVRWAALPDSLLSADGWIALAEAGIQARVAAVLPPFKLDDGTALALRVAALEGWTVTGTLGLTGAVAIENGKPAGHVTVSAAGVEAASTDAGLELHNVNGTVTMNVADSISTPLTQRVTAGRVKMGTMEWTDAAVVFSLKNPSELFINELSAGWLGGRVSTAGVRINPAEPKFEAALVADRISLRELLALAAEGRARGEGLMSGRVPMKVDWPEVSFGTGLLRSQSATGELEVLDTKWLSDIMDKSDPRFITDRDLSEVKNRILRALTDFEYDRLTFAFAEEPESRGMLRVTTHGKGREGAKPQELDLTLNISGVDDLLKYGLRSKQKYDELTNPKLSN